VENLRQQVSSYEKDKMTLQLTKQRLLQADKQFKNLEWEKEVLQQRFGKIETERDELYARFEASIYEMQQKMGLKGLLLERKVEALHEALEKKEAQLSEVLAASNLDTPTLNQVNKKLEEVMDNKNQIIKALKYDVSKVRRGEAVNIQRRAFKGLRTSQANGLPTARSCAGQQGAQRPH